MPAFIKDKEQAPDIIYTQQFVSANVNFLNYTERDEAVDINNDFVVANENIQRDPEEEMAGYLGYMDRSAATELEDDVSNKYPTFNATSFNLNESKHDLLKNNLKAASDNNAMLWQGVVSYDSDFLNRTKIRNSENGHVDQRKIKEAVQKQVDKMLKEENMDVPETFWWADIHLNKEHVHVHLAISQTQNTRQLTKDGEPKGTFKEKSFEHFKSAIHHSLEQEQDKNIDLKLERKINVLQKDLIDNLKVGLESANQKRLLNQIYQSLPKYSDKRKWRASNNSNDFKESSVLTDKFIDNLLKTDLADDYKGLKEAFDQQDKRSREKYGQHISDTVSRKDNQLKNKLKNRVYDSMRAITVDDLEDDLISRIKSVGIDGNNEIIDRQKVDLSKLDPNSLKAKDLKKELGLRRNFVRIENLKIQNRILGEKISQFESLENVDPELKQFFVASSKEQRLLNKLSQEPAWKRNKSLKDQNHFTSLKNKYVDVQQVSINAVKDSLFRSRLKQLQTESVLVLKNIDDPMIKVLYPNRSKNWVKLYYQTQERVLKTKRSINQNNATYKNNEVLKREKNRELFNNLKRDYRFLNGDKISSKDADRLLKVDGAELRKEVKKRPNNEVKVGLRGLSRSMASIKRTSQRDMAAMKRRAASGDDLDRMDKEAELEIESGIER